MNKDGHTLKVPCETRIILPIQAIMTDEDYYKNADCFEPERFLNGGLKMFKDKGQYLGFGDGPRACLGKKFTSIIFFLYITKLKKILKYIFPCKRAKLLQMCNKLFSFVFQVCGLP